MAAKKKMLYTQEGYDLLVKELNYLKNEKREEIKEAIAVARSFGDLSENAEYDAARNAQAENEARILKLKYDIENAEVYDASRAVRGVVDIGSVVTVYDEEMKEECIWRIVGSNEADVVSGKISDQSPVGKALIGHRAGDVITGVVEASGYNFTYRIVRVGRE
jgi:transcription elongation factor GreA